MDTQKGAEGYGAPHRAELEEGYISDVVGYGEPPEAMYGDIVDDGTLEFDYVPDDSPDLPPDTRPDLPPDDKYDYTDGVISSTGQPVFKTAQARLPLDEQGYPILPPPALPRWRQSDPDSPAARVVSQPIVPPPPRLRSLNELERDLVRRGISWIRKGIDSRREQ